MSRVASRSQGPIRRRSAHLRPVAWLLCLAFAAWARAEPNWTLIGVQGLVRYVLVPAGQETNRDAYEAQLARLCQPEASCFVNFYGNSTGAKLELPLPDAIANEATATYRRSMKNGAQLFRWSCRLQVVGEPCF